MTDERLSHECRGSVWSAVDHGRDSRAHLCPGTDRDDELLLVIEGPTGSAIVTLSEAALRRGAQATGAWLIERAEATAEEQRRLVADLHLLTDDHRQERTP